MELYSPDFEEDHQCRSDFIRKITLQQLNLLALPVVGRQNCSTFIPKTLIQYWHDPSELPDDVRECLNSWDRLREEGFEIRIFDDSSAAAYIADKYGVRESSAFARCRHPAMRSDYLRMCFVLAEGGMYVDADDVLIGDGWRRIFSDDRLKIQPLCYDIPSSRMIPAPQIWQHDLPTDGRIFYVNNDPIAAPPGHSVIARALARSTEKLLGATRFPEIQSTTGPGNLTAVLAAHAHGLIIANKPFDFELLPDWDDIAETRWELSYRKDARNWRNMSVTEDHEPE